MLCNQWLVSVLQDTACPPDAVRRLCNAVLVPPSPAVLTNLAMPPSRVALGQTAPAQGEAEPDDEAGPGIGTAKRRSVCLASKPAFIVKPAEQARDTKLKKLGLPPPTSDDHVVERKRRLLQSFKGQDIDMAAAAVGDLLGMPA
jgi:hypothetical protein